MNNAAAVGERECASHLSGDFNRVRHGQGSIAGTAQVLIQTFAFDELEYKHNLIVAGLSGVEDLNDMGMRQPGSSVSLGEQPAAEKWVYRQMRRQDLDGNRAPELRVFAVVNG